MQQVVVLFGSNERHWLELGALRRQIKCPVIKLLTISSILVVFTGQNFGKNS